MTVSSGVIEVSATEGTREIGSEDIIHRIMQHYFSMSNEIWTAIRDSDLAVQRLKREVERAMLEFSAGSHTSTTIEVQNSQGGTILRDELTRKMFNQLCEEVLMKTMKHVRRMLNKAKEMDVKVKDILMLGGGTRITKVKYVLQSAFPSMNVIHGETEADHSKVRGLAVHAAIIQHQIKSPLLLDVTSYPIGLFASKVNKTVIRQFSPLPFQKTVVYGTAEDNQQNIGTAFYEGHSPKPGENLMIYSLVVDKLRKRPAGIGRIEIEYELSADGLLQVYATEINNREAVTSLKPKNILLDEDMINIFTRWEKLLKRSDTYIARVNEQNALERCVYTMSYLCTQTRVGDDVNVDAVSRIIRGHTKWVQRSGYLDPVNFKDQKHKLKKSLRIILSKKTFETFSNIC